MENILINKSNKCKNGKSIEQLLAEEDQLRENIIKGFNKLLVSWYEEAEHSCGVKGKGNAYFEDSPRKTEEGFLLYHIHVHYEENGEKFHTTCAAEMEQLIENEPDWLFQIWAGGSMRFIPVKQ